MRGWIDRDRTLLISYWLRAVRIGIIVTALTVAVLAAVPFIPGHGRVDVVPYTILLIVAAAGAAGIAALPWTRMFEGPWGLWGLFLWSASDIALVSVAVVFTGGATSDVFFVYALTTVFFGAACPPVAQAVLLAFTDGGYLTALAATGWHVGAATLFLRLSLLAVLALLTNFLAGELVRQIGATGEARTRSERWAAMLSTVAAASRRMSLDPDDVIDAGCDALIELGFDTVTLSGMNDDGLTFRVVRSRGLPGSAVGETYPSTIGATSMVLRAGGSVVVEDDASLLDALPELRGSGSRSLVASPVWMGGWLCAVLVAGGRRSRAPSRQEVEAIEMVAGQLGMALENVQRFQQERNTVERLGELDRLKSDFLSTVSHELRSPVTVMKGVGLTLERAWEDVDEVVRREMIAGLNANATLLEGLIANLLDLSRLAGSGAEVRFEPFELSETLLRTAERFRRQFPSHGLRDRVPPGLVARADPLLIERAVENLLSNVAKHTPPGTTAQLVGRAEAHDIVVEVSDDGPGVDEAAVPHLGERFFRTGDINTRPKGLGLGLALVREILDLHGSALEVESRPGSGLRVWFRLGAERPDPSPDPATTPGSILLDAR